MEKKFIMTFDSITASKLVSLGYKQIKSANENIWFFINDKKLVFSGDIDVEKIKYTNIFHV